MTCVVALITPARILMAYDSFVGNETDYRITVTPKAKQIGNALVGFSGSWRTGQQVFKAFERMGKPNLDQFVANFVATDDDWTVLFAQAGKLYEVQADKSTVEIAETAGGMFHAIGSGAGPALGSLYVDHVDRVSVTTALEASQAFISQVRGPFYTLEMPH